MSDSPIQTQANQAEKTPMADISIFSSLISGGFQVWSSKIYQETQLKVADKNRETQLKLEMLRNELKKASELEQFERQKQLHLRFADF